MTHKSYFKNSCDLRIDRNPSGLRPLFRKCQTATEYLIILAVVIVIALIVVGVLGEIPSIGSSVSQHNMQAANAPVGISNVKHSGGGLYFKIQNNQPNNVQIQNITVNDKLISLNGIAYPFMLKVGQKKTCKAFADSASGIADIKVNYKDIETGASFDQENSLKHKIPDYDIWDGLVGYWSFDDYNSTHVMDMSGNGNDGRIEGDASTTNSGVMGNGMSFDGDMDYILIGDKSSLNLTEQTRAIWIKKNIGTNDNIFLSNVDWDYAAEESNSFRVMWDNSTGGNVVFYHYKGFSDPATWTLFVIVYQVDGNDVNVEWYENGVFKNNYSNSQGFNPSPLGSIGARYNGATSFNGTLDEVMVWDRALSASEVSALYEIGK